MGKGHCSCAVAQCGNTALKSTNVIFHVFPKDNHLQREWTVRCKRAYKVNVKTARVCSVHFRPDDYKRDLRNELLGLPLRKKLLPTAIPSVNIPNWHGEEIAEGGDVNEEEYAGDEATPALSDEIDIKEEPIESDPYEQPEEEIEQIYSKEENIKLEIREDVDVCDPLQLKQEEPKNEVGPISCCSEPESVIPVGAEDDNRTGGSGSSSLATRVGLPIGMDNALQNTTKQGACCDISSSSHLQHSCSICKKTFAHLKEHKHVDNHDFLHSCSVCHKTFKCSLGLWAHSQVHAKRHYECKVCHKVYNTVGKLRKHSQVHTYELPYTCGVCLDTFTERRHLKRHSRQHTGERFYACTICRKKFTRSSSLKNHLLLHTGEHPYACGVCNKTFTQISYLTSHSQMHTGKKPFTCTICRKKFSYISGLKNHVNGHKDKRPYSCDVCHRRFMTNGSLWHHLALHTGKRPYSCGVCHKRYMKHGTLMRHLQHHSELTLHESSQYWQLNLLY